MQTLVPGNKLLKMKTNKSSFLGFSLLEMLVVVAIVGIALSFISVNFSRPNAKDIDSDAEKLAQLIELAQEQMALMNKRMRLVLTKDQFYFESNIKNQWVRLEDHELLHPRKWTAPLEGIRILSSNEAKTQLNQQSEGIIIPISSEPISPKIALELTRGGKTVQMITNSSQEYVTQYQ